MSTRKFTPSRRGFMAAGLAGTALVSFVRPVFGQAPLPALADYVPKYFSADEWAFMQAATARLVPSEGKGPGAVEARVPVFIDRQLAGDFGTAADWFMNGPHDPGADPRLGFQSPLSPAQIYREGIRTFDTWCRETRGAMDTTALTCANPADTETAAMLLAASPDMDLGARLYLDNCNACHLRTGTGANTRYR